MSATKETLARSHTFAVGRQVGDVGSRIGILERTISPLVPQKLRGLLENHGTDTITLQVAQGVPAVGTVTFDADAVDNETIVLDDGPGAAVTITFDTNASVTESATLRAAPVVDVTNRSELAEAFVEAVNGSALAITARLVPSQGAASGSPVVVELTNDQPGTAGNVALAGTYGGTAVGMAGGTGAVHNIDDAGGSSVATLAVVPGGRAEFDVLLVAADLAFLTFNDTTGADNVLGELTLSWSLGDFELRTTYA